MNFQNLVAWALQIVPGAYAKVQTMIAAVESAVGLEAKMAAIAALIAYLAGLIRDNPPPVGAEPVSLHAEHMVGVGLNLANLEKIMAAIEALVGLFGQPAA